MKQRFAQAVIAAFREADGGTQLLQLARLNARDWRRGLHWLDASGLALYLRQQVASSCTEQCVPSEIMNALDQRLEANKLRTAQLFSEFETINDAFQKNGLCFANLKGFSLIPDYCPDPSFRSQFDLDFMISYSELSRCQAILESFGYAVTGRHGNVVEFKAGKEHHPSIRDLYKPQTQRSVELHCAKPSQATPDTGDRPLLRRRNRIWNGVSFPALADVDMFLAQANHLLRHLKSEWIRISWLLEFRTFVNARTGDTEFWQDVRTQAATDAESSLAVGVAVLLATRAFGGFRSPELLAWSIEAVPSSIRLWLNRYGETVLWSDFPGTKLYLLLDGELSNTGNNRKINVGKLFPLHLPPRIAYHDRRGSVRAILSHIRFTLFRLRFHVVEGWRYVIAAQQWKRMSRQWG